MWNNCTKYIDRIKLVGELNLCGVLSTMATDLVEFRAMPCSQNQM